MNVIFVFSIKFFTMESGFFDNDKLISAVHSEEAIWNKISSDYSKKNAREGAWRSVLHVMYGEEVHTWDEAKQANTILALQQKWKNLRNSFARELANRRKKKTGSKKTWKTYVYFEQMSFLMSIMGKAATDDNFSSSGDDGNCEDDEESQQSFNEMPQSQDEDETEMNEQRRAFASAKKQKHGTHDFAAARDNLKRKLGSQSADAELAIVLKKSLQWRQQKEENENSDTDRQFLLSLLSDFKKVPESQKANVKIEILRAVSNGMNPAPLYKPIGTQQSTHYMQYSPLQRADSLPYVNNSAFSNQYPNSQSYNFPPSLQSTHHYPHSGRSGSVTPTLNPMSEHFNPNTSDNEININT